MTRRSQKCSTAIFDVSESDAQMIAKVVVRAASLLGEEHMGDRLSLAMDLTAAHANGCPLDLERLLSANDFNFKHDIVGIVNHLDRTSGQLVNHFWPRCARPQGVAS